MADLSKNYENFNIVLEQFKKEIEETERSVVTAVGKINEALSESNNLIASVSLPKISTLPVISEAEQTFQDDASDALGNIYDNSQKILECLEEIEKNTGKIDALTKEGGGNDNKNLQTEAELKSFKGAFKEGIEKFSDSFDSFKDAISALADQLLTVKDMGNIADKSRDLQYFADMTKSDIKDVFHTINVGNRYGAKETQSLLLYKDMANINQALQSGDLSGLKHRKDLETLNEQNANVLKDGLTPEQRMDEIRKALQKMQSSEDPKEKTEALEIARTLTHDIPALFKMLTDKQEKYQYIKEDEDRTSDLESKSNKTNIETADANARFKNTNTANDHLATAKSAPYLQGKANRLHDFIQDHEEMVANFKATVAITNDVNEKLGIFKNVIDALIGVLGMLASIKFFGKGVLKGGKKIKELADKKRKDRRSKTKTDKTKREVSNETSDKKKREVSNEASDKTKREVSNEASDKKKREVSNEDSDKKKREVSNEDSDKKKREVSNEDSDKKKREVSNEDSDKKKREVSNEDSDKKKREVSNETSDNAKNKVSNEAVNKTKQEISQKAEQTLEKTVGKGGINTVEKAVSKGSWWTRAINLTKKFGKSIAKISLKRLPQKMALSAASGVLGPAMVVVDGVLLAKDLYDAYKEVTSDGDGENKQTESDQQQKIINEEQIKAQQQKNKEEKEKAKEIFKKKIEQSKKDLDNKSTNDIPESGAIVVPSPGPEAKGGPCAMANPHNMITAKQTQLANTTLNTNNNQKFNTVIHVNSMATDAKSMAQEVKQAFNNKMLAQAYGVQTSDSNQRTMANQA